MKKPKGVRWIEVFKNDSDIKTERNMWNYHIHNRNGKISNHSSGYDSKAIAGRAAHSLSRLMKVRLEVIYLPVTFKPISFSSSKSVGVTNKNMIKYFKNYPLTKEKR